jgi:hypothetical protein
MDELIYIWKKDRYDEIFNRLHKNNIIYGVWAILIVSMIINSLYKKYKTREKARTKAKINKRTISYV